MAPRLDGSPAREDYLDLFRDLKNANRDSFAAEMTMTNFIPEFAVKIPAVAVGVVFNVI